MARVPFPFQVRDLSGDVVSGATVTITLRGGGAATHYSAETGGTSSTAATTTDANGLVQRWLDEGSYDAAITGVTVPYARSFEAVRGDGVTNLANNSVGTTQLANASVGTAELQDSSLTPAEIAPAAITEAKLADDVVSTRTLAPSAVTEPKLVSTSVNTRVLADNSVTNAKLATGSVIGDHLQDDVVTAAKVADNSVSGTPIQAGAVTNAKLANATITTSDFADGAIRREHISQSVWPVGMVLPFSGTVAPGGWSFCDGTALAVADFPALYDALFPPIIGTITSGSNIITAVNDTSRVDPTHMYIANETPHFIDSTLITAKTANTIMLSQNASGSQAATPIRLMYAGQMALFNAGAATFFLPDMRGRTPVGANPASTNSWSRPYAVEGTTISQRSPYHGHSLGNLSVNGTGTHAHSYWEAITNGQIRAPQSSAERCYGGSSAVVTSGSIHTHNQNGFFGNSSYVNNAVSFLAANYIIKVL